MPKKKHCVTAGDLPLQRRYIERFLSSHCGKKERNSEPALVCYNRLEDKRFPDMKPPLYFAIVLQFFLGSPVCFHTPTESPAAVL